MGLFNTILMLVQWAPYVCSTRSSLMRLASKPQYTSLMRLFCSESKVNPGNFCSIFYYCVSLLTD